ncbi:Mitochondrial import inner membrane translocase subunit tim23 [Ophiocordyceps camponoti-floridani]|uniref:Mitochondrial import inner membrane translocase subunit tim23 n=1 Tax=Ophiocordyceps camponoti-floridani TaxID=2030778 RepID=A0A8H4Q8K3_9HYPO|nr:Mitochondrial import inner membrane translocase subunit tim23 [Ophiocordyceps camponoti-floridani]
MSSLWNSLTGGSKQSQAQAHTAVQTRAVGQTSPGLAETDEPEPVNMPLSLTPGTDAYIIQRSAFSDPSLLHPLAGLDKPSLEYLTLDESALSDLPGGQSVLPSRGFTDDLCYGTGITYLTALSIGGAWGLQEGLRRSDGQPPKLRLNSVLNAVTRRGPFLGNSAGAVAITYNCINSLIGHLRGKHAASNSVLAGALSGMVFKSTRGLRPMMISGGIVGSIAAVWAVFRRSVFPVPDRSAPITTM